MPSRTRFAFLMHPKEFKEEKAATGRLTHLCLPNSELHVGINFDAHEEVQARLGDPAYFPVLLYPSPDAVEVRGGALASMLPPDRQLLVVLIDATWSLSRKMLRLSRSLQALPRIMFNGAAPSRYLIKQQPHPSCLSTLEATHELLLALEQAGLDSYAAPTQLLDLFARMQAYQLRCASDASISGYRRRPYKPPALRRPLHGRSGARRQKLFQPTPPTNPPGNTPTAPTSGIT